MARSARQAAGGRTCRAERHPSSAVARVRSISYAVRNFARTSDRIRCGGGVGEPRKGSGPESSPFSPGSARTTSLDPTAQGRRVSGRRLGAVRPADSRVDRVASGGHVPHHEPAVGTARMPSTTAIGGPYLGSTLAFAAGRPPVDRLGDRERPGANQPNVDAVDVGGTDRDGTFGHRHRGWMAGRDRQLEGSSGSASIGAEELGTDGTGREEPEIRSDRDRQFRGISRPYRPANGW